MRQFKYVAVIALALVLSANYVSADAKSHEVSKQLYVSGVLCRTPSLAVAFIRRLYKVHDVPIAIKMTKGCNIRIVRITLITHYKVERQVVITGYLYQIIRLDTSIGTGYSYMRVGKALSL